MARLGMTVEAQDPGLGYVNVYGPAPRPLNEEEWEARGCGGPARTREIIGPASGYFAIFFNFDPKGLESVINATIVEVPAGTGDLVHCAHARSRAAGVGFPPQGIPAADRCSDGPGQDVDRGRAGIQGDLSRP